MANSIGTKTIDYKKIMDFIAKPFAPNEILWRVGQKSKDKQKGLVFAYMDARAIQARLDALVEADIGVIDWCPAYTPIDLGTIEVKDWTGPHTVNVKGFMCTLTLIMSDGRTMVRQDGANITDFEPVKGGMSDALKRAASAFGMGRYLYKLPSLWVPINPKGQIVNTPKLPMWALPDKYIEEHPDYVTAVIPEGEVLNTLDAIQEHNTQQQGDGKHIIKGKKHHGEFIEDITDIGFLQWVSKNYSDEGAVDAAVKKIAQLQAGEVQ